MDIFKDPTFAWELLEWEIAIEMDEDLNGQAIAHLLELYMVVLPSSREEYRK